MPHTFSTFRSVLEHGKQHYKSERHPSILGRRHGWSTWKVYIRTADFWFIKCWYKQPQIHVNIRTAPAVHSLFLRAKWNWLIIKSDKLFTVTVSVQYVTSFLMAKLNLFQILTLIIKYGETVSYTCKDVFIT